MTEKEEYSKISLISSNKSIFANVYTLKLPNVFTLPEYEDNSFELSSQSFQMANATWCFRVCSKNSQKGCHKAFGVYMVKVMSQKPQHIFFYKIILLDGNDKNYGDYDEVSYLVQDDQECFMRQFDNKSPSYDRRDSLTLIIYLLPYETTQDILAGVIPLPTQQNLPAKMSEKMKDCKMLSALSKKEKNSNVYTLKLPNFFTLSEYNGTLFRINSPSFELVNATWCFHFFSSSVKTDDYKGFSVYIVRIKSKKGKKQRQKFIFTITLLDSNDESYDYDMDICLFERDDKERFMRSFNNEKPYDTRDTLTLIINLFPYEAAVVDEDLVPLIMDGGIEEVKQDFKEISLHARTADDVPKVEGEEFQSHRRNLATSSPVSSAKMMKDTKEKITGVENIVEHDPKVFSVFLNYLRTGRIENNISENVLKLYAIADKYQVKELKEKCIHHMSKNISIDNFCGVYSFSIQHDEEELKEACIQFLAENYLDILWTSKWKAFLSENPITGNKLKKKCMDHMLMIISIDNFCDVLTLSVQRDEEDLKKACTQFFAENYFDIFLTSKWKIFLNENPVIGNELKETCMNHLLRNITIDNFYDVLSFSVQHDEKDLKEACIQFFGENALNIVKKAKWHTFFMENPIIGNELFIKHLQLNKS